MRKWRNCTFNYSARSFGLHVDFAGCPQCGVHPAQKIRAEGSSNGSEVRRAGVTSHKKSELRPYGFLDFAIWQIFSPRVSSLYPLGTAASFRQRAHKKSTPRSYGMGIVGLREGPRSHERLPPRLWQCGASAGHVAVCNVMVMMVGNRRAPGATILGGALKYITCQPSLLCPTDGSCTS